jgi:hypothetical protein
MKTSVFFRVDDAFDTSADFLYLFNYFISKKLPVNFQVIPSWATDSFFKFINRFSKSDLAYTKFNQHGLEHEQIINGEHHWSEFGGKRTYQDQFDTIRTGKSILEDRLGTNFDATVFTPPQHKIDPNTIKTLHKLDFKIISLSNYCKILPQIIYKACRVFNISSIHNRAISYHEHYRPEAPLFELSASVIIDDGNQIILSPDQALAEFLRARRTHKTVGIMMHCKPFRHKSEKFLDEFLSKLNNLPDIEFLSINDIAHNFTAKTQCQ